MMQHSCLYHTEVNDACLMSPLNTKQAWAFLACDIWYFCSQSNENTLKYGT